ncbi:hypothetical protein, partial [Paenibacillus xylanexedens]|uniref:hypothetical protein n=1 Tax=Paenibacillus xylanexedens TaxID=528191 RepID=UPI001C92D28A
VEINMVVGWLWNKWDGVVELVNGKGDVNEVWCERLKMFGNEIMNEKVWRCWWGIVGIINAEGF